MHFFVQVVTELGGKNEVGVNVSGDSVLGGGVTSDTSIPGITAIGVQSDLATDNKLGVGSKSKSCS